MPTIFALVACGLIACLAVLQVALLAGAPLGRFAWGGAEDVLPPRLRARSAAAIVVYALFVLVILQAVGIVALLNSLVGDVAIYVVAACFFVGFVFSALSRSAAERALMTPVSIALAALCLFVGVTGHLPH
jgi:hypothetical protein